MLGAALKGAVCQHHYSLEQAGWVNQTVPLSYNYSYMNQLRYLAYARKSTDSEDMQVQSIPDQEREFDRIKQSKNLNVIKVFCESKSAKKPGRPMFNDMMQMIQNGEADGIICWKLNRLARNPLDGGQIQWLLQQGTLKSIIVPGKEYLPTDNVLLMAVELGIANQFILDLSKDVRRGLHSKAEKGWRPGPVGLGYLNDKYGDKGSKQIFKDEERFPLVRKMWDLLLTGAYTVPRIQKIVSDEWGLRTKKGTKLSLSTIYGIFTKPFYYGEYSFKGEVHRGKHEAMITVAEFDRAQAILCKKGKPRSKEKRLPFNGIISCGECGGMITSEEKHKPIKSTTQIHHYIYHHCSRRKKDKPCHQKAINHEDLKSQITAYLDSITIPREFLHWALDVLRSNNQIEEQNRNTVLKNHEHNYKSCLARVDNLVNLYISPENAQKELLSEDEYKTRKNALVKERTQIEAAMRAVGERVDEWLELTEKTFEFATYARHWFEKGDYEQKSHILQALGQNFALFDGKLTIHLQEPLLTIKNGMETESLRNARLEPSNSPSNNGENSSFEAVFSAWSG